MVSHGDPSKADGDRAVDLRCLQLPTHPRHASPQVGQGQACCPSQRRLADSWLTREGGEPWSGAGDRWGDRTKSGATLYEGDIYSFNKHCPHIWAQTDTLQASPPPPPTPSF